MRQFLFWQYYTSLSLGTQDAEYNHYDIMTVSSNHCIMKTFHAHKPYYKWSTQNTPMAQQTKMELVGM